MHTKFWLNEKCLPLEELEILSFGLDHVIVLKIQMTFFHTLTSLYSEHIWVLAFNNNIFQTITAFQQVVVL